MHFANTTGQLGPFALLNARWSPNAPSRTRIAAIGFGDARVNPHLRGLFDDIANAAGSTWQSAATGVTSTVNSVSRDVASAIQNNPVTRTANDAAGKAAQDANYVVTQANAAAQQVQNGIVKGIQQVFAAPQVQNQSAPDTGKKADADQSAADASQIRVPLMPFAIPSWAPWVGGAVFLVLATGVFFAARSK